MKKVLWLIVCLMTMVVSANAQSKVIKIDNDIYCYFTKNGYNLSIKAERWFKHNGYMYDNSYGYWCYNLDKQKIVDFVGFLKLIEKTFTHYNKIAEDNNVNEFRKELDIEYYTDIVLLIDDKGVFSYAVYRNTPLTVIYDTKEGKHTITIVPKIKKEKYSLRENLWEHRMSLTELIFLIKKLKNIENKVLEKYDEIAKENKIREQKHQLELEKKQKIEELFE